MTVDPNTPLMEQGMLNNGTTSYYTQFSLIFNTWFPIPAHVSKCKIYSGFKNSSKNSENGCKNKLYMSYIQALYVHSNKFSGRLTYYYKVMY